MIVDVTREVTCLADCPYVSHGLVDQMQTHWIIHKLIVGVVHMTAHWIPVTVFVAREIRWKEVDVAS
jgi:hypothetical protein